MLKYILPLLLAGCSLNYKAQQVCDCQDYECAGEAYGEFHDDAMKVDPKNRNLKFWETFDKATLCLMAYQRWDEVNQQLLIESKPRW